MKVDLPKHVVARLQVFFDRVNSACLNVDSIGRFINGDGVNDTWVIHNIENHPSAVIRVFNRWGSEVFYSKNYKNDWDGSYQNKDTLPESSSYLYEIDLGGDGSVVTKGWLYITR